MKLLFINLVIVTFIPLTLIIFGYLLAYHYPKRNWFVGYRSNYSMLNDDTWAYGNSECGKKMFKAGLIMVLPSVITIVLIYLILGDTNETYAMYIDLCQVAVIILVVILTEIDLHKEFNKDGTRKNIQ